jgi:hypothetical protein
MKDKQMEGVETEDGGNREHEQNGKGVQILCFWTLSILLSLSKNRPVYF